MFNIYIYIYLMQVVLKMTLLIIDKCCNDLEQ